ncbi:hypothetical protein QJQ45_008012 [Haematococcus lacustris]|nr:hypothetical protein QJQ45_008012 [Haematococcus lacustris]
MQANGAAHWVHNHNNSWHAKKCKRHTLMRGVAAAGLEAGAVVPSEVVEARLHDQLVLWVEACSKRALLASLLLGLMVRDSFTRVTVLADGLYELLEEIPAEDADIPDFAERNLYLQLGRGVPPPGLHSRPSAAVVAVLAAYPTLGDELDAIPRYPHDCNTVDDVGQKLETSFATSLNELFKRKRLLHPESTNHSPRSSGLETTDMASDTANPWKATLLREVEAGYLLAEGLGSRPRPELLPPQAGALPPPGPGVGGLLAPPL